MAACTGNFNGAITLHTESSAPETGHEYETILTAAVRVQHVIDATILTSRTTSASAGQVGRTGLQKYFLDKETEQLARMERNIDQVIAGIEGLRTGIEGLRTHITTEADAIRSLALGLRQVTISALRVKAQLVGPTVSALRVKAQLVGPTVSASRVKAQLVGPTVSASRVKAQLVGPTVSASRVKAQLVGAP